MGIVGQNQPSVGRERTNRVCWLLNKKPVSTKPIFLMYISLPFDVSQEKRLSGHGPLCNVTILHLTLHHTGRSDANYYNLPGYLYTCSASLACLRLRLSTAGSLRVRDQDGTLQYTAFTSLSGATSSGLGGNVIFPHTLVHYCHNKPNQVL